MRELLALPHVELHVRAGDLLVSDADKREMEASRIRRRNVQVMQNAAAVLNHHVTPAAAAKRPCQQAGPVKHLHLDFYRAPVSIGSTSGRAKKGISTPAPCTVGADPLRVRLETTKLVPLDDKDHLGYDYYSRRSSFSNTSYVAHAKDAKDMKPTRPKTSILINDDKMNKKMDPKITTKSSSSSPPPPSPSSSSSSSSPPGQKAVGVGIYEELVADAVLCSVGYRGVAHDPDVPWHSKRGVVQSEDGRVVGRPGVYAVGWIKRGATGIIGTNLTDAEGLVDIVSEDISKAQVTE